MIDALAVPPSPAQNAADLLPTPIKPVKTLPADDVVAIIRQAREADWQGGDGFA